MAQDSKKVLKAFKEKTMDFLKKKRLQGKVIVITGSSRGIGREAARACAEEGANVVLCARHASALQQALQEFSQDGLEAAGIQADVCLFEDIKRLFEFACKTYGRIDVWVNNAAVFDGFEALEEKSIMQIEQTIQANLCSVMVACKILIPYLTQKGGIIINMSGRGGEFRAAPFMSTYAASKAAVVSLTKSLAGENVRAPVSIHSLYPGMVDTSMHEDIKIGKRSSFDIQSFPYVKKAFGVPMDAVTRTIVRIASQIPGRTTGKNYSLISGLRLFRAIVLVTWYSFSGRIKRA